MGNGDKTERQGEEIVKEAKESEKSNRSILIRVHRSPHCAPTSFAPPGLRSGPKIREQGDRAGHQDPCTHTHTHTHPCPGRQGTQVHADFLLHSFKDHEGGRGQGSSGLNSPCFSPFYADVCVLFSLLCVCFHSASPSCSLPGKSGHHKADLCHLSLCSLS